jgi:hypothetical protein
MSTVKWSGGLYALLLAAIPYCSICKCQLPHMRCHRTDYRLGFYGNLGGAGRESQATT